MSRVRGTGATSGAGSRCPATVRGSRPGASCFRPRPSPNDYQPELRPAVAVLNVGEQVIILAEPARQRLAAYLDYRAATWPTTINPHLFINRRSWMHDRPVTPWWIHHRLGMSGQLIRQDRILDEAHATSGDLRMLCELLGLSTAGAMRYIETVNSPDRGGTYRI